MTPPVPSRAQALLAVKVGDVIFGLGAGGQPKLLLVYKADQQGFSARHVTSQMKLRFDRHGQTRVFQDGGHCTIVSIATLPPDMHKVALGLDHKMGTGKEHPDFVLDKAEMQLILTHDKFFKAHLLPGTEAIVLAAERLDAVRKILILEWDPVDVRDTPPALNEYDAYLPALVDLLSGPASVDAVSSFLADIATRRMRPPRAPDRHTAAANSLLRLRQSWI